jgi:hypothetical protein
MVFGHHCHCHHCRRSHLLDDLPWTLDEPRADMVDSLVL